MDYQLKYGKNNLSICLDDNSDVTVVNPKDSSALKDPKAALIQEILSPIGTCSLKEMIPKGDRIGIILNDITRATPSEMILSAILTVLSEVPTDRITLFVGTGTHRKNTDSELREMFGSAITESFRIIQNDSADESTQVFLGKTSFGHEIWLNRELVNCGLVVLTGFIEPHFFAGFSGGGKAIMPGMAGNRTIFANHGAEMIANPHSVWGITSGNPIYGEILEIAEKIERSFLVNVAMNSKHEINGVFCGEIRHAHQAGCDFVKQNVMVPVPKQFDIVIGTNSGYPLDLNLYQTVKGISAAARIVKNGGTILIASECSDGIPEEGMFKTLLKETNSPQAFFDKLREPEFLVQDQWQVQILMQILQKAKVCLYSDRLSDEQIRACHLIPIHSIEEFCRKEGKGKSICIMPEGPLTIPYLT